MSEKPKLILVVVGSHIHPHERNKTHLINSLDYLQDTRGIQAIVVRSIESAVDHDVMEWADGAGVPVLMVPENWRDGPAAPARQAEECCKKANAAMHWCEEPFDRANTAMMAELERKAIKLWRPEPRVYEKAWAASHPANQEPPKPATKSGWDD